MRREAAGRMSGPKLDALTTGELKRLATREADRLRKQRTRAHAATLHAKAALTPNPEGYKVTPMPAGLSKIRGWVRAAHDAYSRRQIGPSELAEVRRSASSVGDL